MTALFNYFIQIVKEQLHVVLAFSPIGNGFRTRIRKFPSLVQCCTIDWFQVKICVLLLYTHIYIHTRIFQLYNIINVKRYKTLNIREIN